MATTTSRLPRLRCGLTLLAALACAGPEERAPSDTARAAGAVTGSARESTAGADTTGRCPDWGDWRLCSVEKRLERAGLVIQRGTEPVRHDFFQVPGVMYETSRAEIQVFLYPSPAARARDTDALDSSTVAPPGRRIIWRWPATLVTSGNLAAIVLSLNARQAERIALALGAGLPPPPR
ncbi:MAG TPA: hypothetical protein VLE53_04245 [Gemmatimonadaceae bacterium]|nr:hypothetical protein [Gemmatimonadaceae bacterium]